MQASIILPVIAVLALCIKSVFGIEINEELQSTIADAVLAVVLAVMGILGVVKAHQSKKLTNRK